MGRLSTLNITRCLYLRPQVWHTHRGWTSEVLAPQSLWSLWTSPLNWRSTAQSGQDKPMHTICHLVFWQLIKHLRKRLFYIKILHGSQPYSSVKHAIKKNNPVSCICISNSTIKSRAETSTHPDQFICKQQGAAMSSHGRNDTSTQ